MFFASPLNLMFFPRSVPLTWNRKLSDKYLASNMHILLSSMWSERWAGDDDDDDDDHDHDDDPLPTILTVMMMMMLMIVYAYDVKMMKLVVILNYVFLFLACLNKPF